MFFFKMEPNRNPQLYFFSFLFFFPLDYNLPVCKKGNFLLWMFPCTNILVFTVGAFSAGDPWSHTCSTMCDQNIRMQKFLQLKIQ